jgi:Ca-activated chloride channel homolog
MHYAYGKYDGHEFPTSDSLFDYDRIMDFILEYGDKALDALSQIASADAEILEKMLQEGMLEKAAGRYRLTPRAIHAMQRKALMEIFAHLPRGSRDSHPTANPGAGTERLEGTKKYQYGDPISELDLNATLRNAVARRGTECDTRRGRDDVGEGRLDVPTGPPAIEDRTSKPERSGTPGIENPPPPTLGLPIRLSESDLELHLVEGSTTIALCILLDMSGSMMRYGRFLSAKKVAMALTALVRQRFPQDSIDLVGFYSTAMRIREDQLPLMMPKQISTYDYVINVKVPLDQAHRTHQHFTNLQLGLQLGRRILGARQAEQKIMFVITDGQPTAHVDGNMLYLQYPPTRATAMATLQEALLCMRAGIRIATFALIEDYFGMEWVEFVDQFTRLSRGVAFYCASGDLANCVMESYLSGKKKKTYLA